MLGVPPERVSLTLAAASVRVSAQIAADPTQTPPQQAAAAANQSSVLRTLASNMTLASSALGVALVSVAPPTIGEIVLAAPSPSLVPPPASPPPSLPAFGAGGAGVGGAAAAALTASGDGGSVGLVAGIAAGAAALVLLFAAGAARRRSGRRPTVVTASRAPSVAAKARSSGGAGVKASDVRIDLVVAVAGGTAGAGRPAEAPSCDTRSVYA